MSSRESILHGGMFNEIKELISNSYLGEIVSTAGIDEYPGRVKIRVYGVFDSQDLGSIPDVDLPYAYPLMNLGFGGKDGGGQYSSPKVGAIVRVVFKDDIYHPRYFAPEYLTEELKQEIKNSPNNFHSLIFDADEQMKVYYSQKSGMMMDYNQSLINIRPDGSILINHKGSSSTIELKGADIDIVTNNSVNVSAPNNVTINSQLVHANGSQTQLGSNPAFHDLLAEPTIVLLKGLATIINNKLPVDTTALALVNAMEDVIKSKTVTTTYQ